MKECYGMTEMVTCEGGFPGKATIKLRVAWVVVAGEAGGRIFGVKWSSESHKKSFPILSSSGSSVQAHEHFNFICLPSSFLLWWLCFDSSNILVGYKHEPCLFFTRRMSSLNIDDVLILIIDFVLCCYGVCNLCSHQT